MKFLSILLAASLALTPVLASADSHNGGTGGTAGRVLDTSVIPVGVYVLGPFGLAIATVFALVGGKDAAPTTTTTTTTN